MHPFHWTWSSHRAGTGFIGSVCPQGFVLCLSYSPGNDLARIQVRMRWVQYEVSKSEKCVQGKGKTGFCKAYVCWKVQIDTDGTAR